MTERMTEVKRKTNVFSCHVWVPIMRNAPVIIPSGHLRVDTLDSNLEGAKDCV